MAVFSGCIFHLTRIDEEPAPGVGRVGGLPDLPPDMEWPKGRDGYLPFLAQLPLDEARAAGALPIDVASGSLLTVFGSAGEDGVSANDALFVVSKHMQLERRRALADVDTYPWCKLETEIMEELPSWEEAVAMVKAELGPVDRNELLAFRDSEWARKPSAAEAVKLGGWAIELGQSITWLDRKNNEECPVYSSQKRSCSPLRRRRSRTANVLAPTKSSYRRMQSR